MGRKTIVLGIKKFGRKETLEYARDKFGWKGSIIGISCFFGFWAWVWGRLTKRKVIYYCIDFYSPEIANNLIDSIFIWAAMQMDKFLVRHCDKVWDISERINEGRKTFGNYTKPSSIIVPLSYPPSYFRFEQKDIEEDKLAFVGLKMYGFELFKKYRNLVWLKNLPLEELLNQLSQCGIGISLWSAKGNNYYGDPGKTKLYSACGLPVIMTGNTPYATIIRRTMAGLIVNYTQESVNNAIREILFNYSFYKRNVKDTWKYINADDIFRDSKLLV